MIATGAQAIKDRARTDVIAGGSSGLAARGSRLAKSILINGLNSLRTASCERRAAF
jgi:hypothetical protein